MDSKPIIHQSQISTFDRCMMQYYYRYCADKKIPPGVAAIRGTSVHKTSEQDLTSKRDKGELLPSYAVTDLAHDAVIDAWAEGVRLSDEERKVGEKRLMSDTIDSSVALASAHHDKLAPVLEPVHIERPWKLKVNNFPVDLQGTIDLQESSGTLRDLKTKAASPPKTAADTSTQLTMYHMAASLLDQEPPSQLVLDHLVALKRGPKIVSLRTTRTEADWKPLLDRIAAMVKAIQAGIFIPTLPDNWVCCDKWCGYWKDICPFGRRNRSTKARG